MKTLRGHWFEVRTYGQEPIACVRALDADEAEKIGAEILSIPRRRVLAARITTQPRRAGQFVSRRAS